MLYLEITASREHIRETRRQVERNRLEASLAQARLSNEAALQEPHSDTSMITNTAWRLERWQGAGW